jgi:hypothetical protein
MYASSKFNRASVDSRYSTWSGSCTPATITSWASNISAYIKSIDTNHLVAIGDEGFYNQPGAPTYPYQYVLQSHRIASNMLTGYLGVVKALILLQT